MAQSRRDTEMIRQWPVVFSTCSRRRLTGLGSAVCAEKSICQWQAAKHTLFPVTPTRNTRPMTVLCPWQTSKLSRLTVSNQVLSTAGTRTIACASRLLHVCCTSLPRVPPVVGCGKKFWAVQNFLPQPTPSRFFPASTRVYKSTIARLKLDIKANNIVCFTGNNFLMWFGRDKAVKRCVTGP